MKPKPASDAPVPTPVRAVSAVESLAGEVWRPVVGYEGMYEVSNHGRIKSFAFKTPRIRKFMHGASEYRRVALGRNGGARYLLVHRLVLEAFVGPCPEGMEACHNDDNPTNNRVENLRWGTRLDNARDRANQGRYARKLTAVVVRQIREAAGTVSKGHLSRVYGVTRATIRAIQRREVWAHVE